MTKFITKPGTYERLILKVDTIYAPTKRERDWGEITAVAIRNGRILFCHEIDEDGIAGYSENNHFNIVTQTPVNIHMQQIFYDLGSRTTRVFDARPDDTIYVRHWIREGTEVEERRSSADDVARWMHHITIECSSFREPLRIDRIKSSFDGGMGEFAERIAHPLAKIALPKIFDQRERIRTLQLEHGEMLMRLRTPQI